MSELGREQIRRWLAETESDNESVIGVSDGDENEDNIEERQDSESDDDSFIRSEASDQDDSELEPHQDVLEREFYIGKDRTSRWYLEPLEPRSSRVRRHNIIPFLHKPGPQGEAKHANTHLKSIECFLDDEIIRKIVDSTNIYITKIKNNFSRDRDAKQTDQIEIKAFIGILYLCGVLRASRRNLMSMWDMSSGTGVEACFLTMSEHRFRFLMRCLRFDDINNRLARRATDKMAPFRDIFEHFVHNCKTMYKPTDYLSLDEQLVAFRGKCPFRQYMPKKPARYGIKVFALTSCNNYYTTNLEVYLGVQPDGPYKVSNSPNDVVCRLVEPVAGSNRNITADNWFSSIHVAQELFENKSLTFIGTLKKNKREVPLCFLPDKDRDVYSSMFGFQKNLCLVSYVPKKNQAVLLISTMHNSKAIDESTGEHRKPAVITSYNETKFGVDIVDKMCGQYDVARNSRRWPLTLFFHIINLAGVNAITVYKANNNNTMICRREFLQTLALDLIKPEIQRRISAQMIPKEIRQRGKLFLKVEECHADPPPVHGVLGRCHLCGRARNKSTRKRCFQCTKWVCPEHQKSVCNECAD